MPPNGPSCSPIYTKEQEGQGTITLPAEPANLKGNIVVNSTTTGATWLAACLNAG